MRNSVPSSKSCSGVSRVPRERTAAPAHQPMPRRATTIITPASNSICRTRITAPSAASPAQRALRRRRASFPTTNGICRSRSRRACSKASTSARPAAANRPRRRAGGQPAAGGAVQACPPRAATCISACWCRPGRRCWVAASRCGRPAVKPKSRFRRARPAGRPLTIDKRVLPLLCRFALTFLAINVRLHLTEKGMHASFAIEGSVWDTLVGSSNTSTDVHERDLCGQCPAGGNGAAVEAAALLRHRGTGGHRTPLKLYACAVRIARPPCVASSPIWHGTAA